MAFYSDTVDGMTLGHAVGQQPEITGPHRPLLGTKRGNYR